MIILNIIMYKESQIMSIIITIYITIVYSLNIKGNQVEKIKNLGVTLSNRRGSEKVIRSESRQRRYDETVWRKLKVKIYKTYSDSHSTKQFVLKLRRKENRLMNKQKLEC